MRLVWGIFFVGRGLWLFGGCGYLRFVVICCPFPFSATTGREEGLPQSPPQRPSCSRRIPFTPTAVPRARIISLADMNKGKTCPARRQKWILGLKIKKTIPNRGFRWQTGVKTDKTCQNLRPRRQNPEVLSPTAENNASP